MKRTVLNVLKLPVEERQLASLLYPPVDEPRPRRRGECEAGPRPCPWVSCRYHLAIDVGPSGSITAAHPGRPLADLPATCALDVADAGGATFEQIAVLLGVTRQAVQKIEKRALVKARKRSRQ